MVSVLLVNSDCEFVTKVNAAETYDKQSAGCSTDQQAGGHNTGQSASQEVPTQPGSCQEGHGTQHGYIPSQLVTAQIHVLQPQIHWELAHTVECSACI